MTTQCPKDSNNPCNNNLCHLCLQVRSKAMALLQRYPISACTRPVLRGAVSLAAADAGLASASAGRQSSAASSSSHYHWQQSGPSSGRSTGPPRGQLSRFADVVGGPGGRGPGLYRGFSRSLSTSRLGGDCGWSPMGSGGGGGGGRGTVANGHAEGPRLPSPAPPPGAVPMEASPMRRAGSREATPPPHHAGAT